MLLLSTRLEGREPPLFTIKKCKLTVCIYGVVHLVDPIPPSTASTADSPQVDTLHPIHQGSGQAPPQSLPPDHEGDTATGQVHQA